MDKALISNRIVLPDKVIAGTLILSRGKIKEVLPAKTTMSLPTEDVGDLTVMPGLVDCHVHINEPGRTDWEGFEAATKAAAAGGITSLIEMPLNSDPVSTSREALKIKLEHAQGQLYVNCGFWGGIVPGNAAEVEGLIEQGAWGFKAFMTHSGIDDFPATTVNDFHQVLPQIASMGMPMLVHAELDTGDYSAALREHPTSYQAYLSSRPDHWETDAIQQLIQLSETYQCRMHVVHVATSQALDMIRAAREENPLFTAETCPHYLHFAAEEIPDGSTIHKCAPPIRAKANARALLQGLKEGTLDFIVSDHSPSPIAMKHSETGDFAQAWGGISGLQWSLPATWTELKAEGLSVRNLSRWMSQAVAEFVGLENKGVIAPGKDADLVVWDPEAEVLPTPQDTFSRHRISPYHGRTLHGKVHATYLQGEKIYESGRILGSPRGQTLLRNR